MQLNISDRKVKIIDTFTNSICDSLWNNILQLMCITIRLKDGDIIIIYPPRKLNSGYGYKPIQHKSEQSILIECENKKDLFEVEFFITDIDKKHYSRFFNSIEIPICMIDDLY